MFWIDLEENEISSTKGIFVRGFAQKSHGLNKPKKSNERFLPRTHSFPFLLFSILHPPSHPIHLLPPSPLILHSFFSSSISTLSLPLVFLHSASTLFHPPISPPRVCCHSFLCFRDCQSQLPTNTHTPIPPSLSLHSPISFVPFVNTLHNGHLLKACNLGSLRP